MNTEFMNKPKNSNNIMASNAINNIINKGSYSIKSFLFNAVSVFGKNYLKKIKSKYSYDIILDNEDYTICKFIEYLKEVDSKFDERPISYNDAYQFNIEDCFFIVNLAENTFMTVLCGNPYLSFNEKYIINAYNNNNSNKDAIKITIYGKYAKKYYNIITSQIIPQRKRDSNQLSIYNITGNSKGTDESFQSIITDLRPRDIDTLFYVEGVKEDILNHIDSFFKNKELYASRNINYKFNMLFYGLPGTGKSSLARALATKYNLDIILVDMNTFGTLDVNMLTSCINGDDKTYIVLLEDIDTIYNTNREDNNLDKDDRKVINKLLQFLDSNSSPNNVIFIATTNYIDKLDSAITRKGRFDYIMNIGPISNKEARKMCNAFECTPEQTNNILSKFDSDNIKQCDLQGAILDTFKEEMK